MSRVFVLLFCAIALAAGIAAQVNEPAINRVELMSPWDGPEGKTTYVGSRRDRSCLDLVRLLQACGGEESLAYGNRIGKNWDVFAVSGRRDSRTRMIDLGVYDWGDQITIPEIDPWPALKDGESRNITINASGADGADGEPGRPGMNGEGTMPVETPRPAATKRPKQTIDYSNSPIGVQVFSTITMKGKVPSPSSYNPFTEVIKGHMYLIRVVDAAVDHYILMRVDDLVRGEKVSVSYFRFPVAP